MKRYILVVILSILFTVFNSCHKQPFRSGAKLSPSKKYYFSPLILSNFSIPNEKSELHIELFGKTKNQLDIVNTKQTVTSVTKVYWAEDDIIVIDQGFDKFSTWYINKNSKIVLKSKNH